MLMYNYYPKVYNLIYYKKKVFNLSFIGTEELVLDLVAMKVLKYLLFSFIYFTDTLLIPRRS